MEKGRLDTTWTVLRKFRYNNDIRLPEELIPSLLKRSPDQSVELTNEAINFLSATFNLFDSDGFAVHLVNFPYNDAEERNAFEAYHLMGSCHKRPSFYQEESSIHCLCW